MIYDTKRFQEIMRKLSLTPNQIYFCVLLLEQDYYKKKEMFEEYAEKHGGFRWLEIEDLEQKGYIANFSDTQIPKTVGIVQTRKGEIKYERIKDVIILEMVIVTPHFKDQIYVDPEIAAEELLSVYPAWITINGKRQSIKIIGDRDEFYEYYKGITGGDIIKHKTIVEAFSHYKKYVDKGKVNGMGIRKALESRLWQDIQELMEQDNVDRDAIKSI
jgi:hypothetical protein